MFRPIKIRRYLAQMHARGHSVDAVLAETGLVYSRLLDPACLIELPQARMVVANMIRLTGDQGIGLEMGRETEMMDLGIIGHAMVSARTVRDAAQLWMRYSNTLVDAMIRLDLQEDAGHWGFTFSELRPLGFVFNFCVEENLMLIRNLGSALAGEPIKLQRMELAYPAPRHEALYQEYFDCPIRFNAPHTRISISAPLPDKPLRNHDSEFYDICLQHCGQILRQITGDSPIAARLRSQLLRCRGQLPKFAEAAQLLGMSARTLRRRLSEEGHNYRDLVNSFRADLAREYLQARMSTKEVAYQLGFSDPNSLRRAFKLWTGSNIVEYVDERRATTAAAAKAER